MYYKFYSEEGKAFAAIMQAEQDSLREQIEITKKRIEAERKRAEAEEKRAEELRKQIELLEKKRNRLLIRQKSENRKEICPEEIPSGD